MSIDPLSLSNSQLTYLEGFFKILGSISSTHVLWPQEPGEDVGGLIKKPTHGKKLWRETEAVAKRGGGGLRRSSRNVSTCVALVRPPPPSPPTSLVCLVYVASNPCPARRCSFNYLLGRSQTLDSGELLSLITAEGLR